MTQSNRSNSVRSRKSATSNSSRVAAVADVASTNSAKRNKTTKPIVRARVANTTDKTRKSAVDEVDLKTEKAKLAEEIKLNVAAVGLELLNEAPAVISKVNNLVVDTTPEGLASAKDLTSVGFTADDEDSADELKIEDSPTKLGLEEKKISVRRIENSEESEGE